MIQKRSSIALMITIALLLTLPGCVGGQNAELKEQSMKVEKYLKEKYGKEFVIASTEYYHAYLGANKAIKSTVYPKDNPELIFYIYSSPGQNDFGESVGPDGKDIAGSHLGVIWSKEFSQEVGELIKRTYPEKPNFCVDVNLRYPTAEKMWGSSPTYNEFVEKYPEDASKLEYDVNIILFEDLDEEKKIEQAKKAFEFFTSIKDRKIINFVIGFNYFASNSKGDMEKLIKQKGTEELICNCLEKTSKYSMFKYRLLIKNDGSVKSYSDVLKSFIVKNK
ncbi:MAG TPA: hypothetical protein VF941_07410 [Clostridia bacterium]